MKKIKIEKYLEVAGVAVHLPKL